MTCKEINILLMVLFTIILFIIILYIGIGCISFVGIVLVFFGFSLWGHVVVYPIYYIRDDFLSGFIWGNILGISISSLLISVIVLLIGWNIELIIITIIIFPFLILLCLLRKASIKYPKLKNNIFLTLLLTTFNLVAAFYILPIKNFGILVDDNYHFAWLFGHDFLVRMVFIDMLSDGIPLRSMFFGDEVINFYWISYVFPAFINNLDFIAIDIRQSLQVSLILYSFLTTSALILFIRKIVNNNRIFVISVIFAYLCYSYVWILHFFNDFLVWLINNYMSFVSVEQLNNFSGFSHGLYQFFLVEPQSVLFFGIMLMFFHLYYSATKKYDFIIIGILLGLSLGIEATNGIMLMLWFCIMTFTLFIQNYRSSTFYHHLLSVIFALLLYFLLFNIQMFSLSTGQDSLFVSPNMFALKYALFYLPIFYGPTFILGIAGIIIFIKNNEPFDHYIYGYLILLAVSLFFLFFIQVSTEYYWGLLKSSRILFFCFLMLSIYFLQHHHHKTHKLGFIVILLALFAFPTIITDNKVASDTNNPSTYIRFSDLEAAEWIKLNLPKAAVVQSEPNYPGIDSDGIYPKYSYSFIPIFAERTTAVGEWKVSRQAHAKAHEVSERFHSVRRMYSTADLNEAYDVIIKYEIDYIYVGSYEKFKYPEGIEKFKYSPEYFDKIFSSKEVDIYHVRK